MLPSWAAGEPGTHTVLVLHSIGLDHSVWDRLLPHLIDTNWVVTCDLPGHGNAAMTPRSTVEGDDVAELLRAHGTGPGTVAALSMGGCVAQSLAIRHPDLVSGLALLDTTAWYGSEASNRWAARADIARRDGFSALVKFQIDRWFTGGFTEERTTRGALHRPEPYRTPRRVRIPSGSTDRTQRNVNRGLALARKEQMGGSPLI